MRIERIKKIASVALICLGLTGCAGGTGNDLADQVIGSVTSRLERDEDFDPRLSLTREALDSAPIRLIYIEVPKAPSRASLQDVGRNGTKVTWLSVDGVAVTIDRGILVATRGYGHDLMAADVSAVRRAISAGGAKNVLRVHDYLNGDDKIERRSFLCDISRLGLAEVRILQEDVRVSRFVEKCQNPDVAFENRYDFAPDGRLVASRQWVSEGLGFILTEELSR